MSKSPPTCSTFLVYSLWYLSFSKRMCRNSASAFKANFNFNQFTIAIPQRNHIKGIPYLCSMLLYIICFQLKQLWEGEAFSRACEPAPACRRASRPLSWRPPSRICTSPRSQRQSRAGCGCNKRGVLQHKELCEEESLDIMQRGLLYSWTASIGFSLVLHYFLE